ncbi:uncharacterized protein MKK02DRAFT_38007 [Dioszegia hungarica]|uniref:Protein CPL1-like domain-containing protein n=1 Tax=Dioszegia hungarica TaxID=4972 RepID=A0AA38H659_9TREE|nr:uncharacterized protein MKK02DRAFT_38007 [Dioszegia hungarica]KAI9634477.1 hypothetical protein MKK02DRAFT_38007 [Dioszegia hungarica]
MPSLTRWLALTFLLLSSTAYAQCVAPYITSPLRGLVTTADFTLSGVVSRDNGCDEGLVRIMRSGSGEIFLSSVNADGTFSVDLSHQPWGPQIYYLLLREDTTDSRPSGPVEDDDADVPIYDNRPTFSGSTDCPYVTLTLASVDPIVARTNEQGFYEIRSQALADGRYTLVATASSDESGSNSASSRPRNFVVSSTQSGSRDECYAPTLTGPGVRSDFRRSTIAGYTATGTLCDDGLVRLMTEETGEVAVIGLDGAGAFNVPVLHPQYGVLHYYLLHTSDTAGLLRSNTVEVTVTCDVPIILEPLGQTWQPNYNEYDPVYIYNRRPPMGGNTGQCRFATIEITGRPTVTVSSDAQGYFKVPPSVYENGAYALIVTGTPDGTAESLSGPVAKRSNQRNFIIDSTEPMPSTVGSRRRSIKPRCKADEELCRFIGVNNRMSIQYRCYPDLSTNLNRCGSCDGPDCADLLNVDGVMCLEGRCQIQTCEKGYILRDNACVKR